MDFLRDEAIEPAPGELVVSEARLGRTLVAGLFLAISVAWCLSPLLHPLAWIGAILFGVPCLGVSLLILPGIARGWLRPWWIVRVRRDELVLRVRSYLNADLDGQPTVVRIPRAEIERLRIVSTERVLPGAEQEADERSSVEWLEVTLVDVNTLELQRLLANERTPPRRRRGHFGAYPVQSQGARTLRVMWSTSTLRLHPSSSRVARRLHELGYPLQAERGFRRLDWRNASASELDSQVTELAHAGDQIAALRLLRAQRPISLTQAKQELEQRRNSA